MGLCGAKTIPHGEATAIYEATGEVIVVHGPTRVCTGYCAGRSFSDVEQAVATENEYIEIKLKDGHTEIRPGPTSEWVHPVNHASVTVKQAMNLGDSELIVVYRKEANESGEEEVRRHLLRGPCLYIPQSASEWVHEFQWTGPDGETDSTQQARKKVGALRLTKLRTIPGKMYYDVEHVRTKDNALITVKLMIFYHLVDVDRMLDSTNDPMGDFINAVSADVIEWCAPKKFDDFLQATDQLNTTAPYTQLQKSGENMGYKIERVVFRGYTAPNSLQKMHDQAIEKRTALSLEKETVAEEQNIRDFKLQKESERQAQQHKLEMEKLNHDLAMKQTNAQSERTIKETEQAMELQRLQNIIKLDKKGEMAAYLTARDCQLPPTVQCATMMTDPRGMPSIPGFRS